ncbi:MAG: caspase family protein [Desulfobacterales bacterium]|nr:caspase family protein [Desulfobacterales bacterium]
MSRPRVIDIKFLWAFGIAAIFLIYACMGLVQPQLKSISAPAVPAKVSEEFPRVPLLQLETGMHTAPIFRIDLDRAQRFMVSGSQDKSVRIWDLESGRLLRTLRVPQGPGSIGKVYGVAASPDGTVVAAGGWTGSTIPGGQAIYIFDCRTGEIRQAIGGLANSITHLKYSPDGRYLAAIMWGPNGLRVYETETYKLVAEDREYADSSYWADFDDAGYLVTTCDDGFIRRYDKNFRLIKKMKAPGGKEPYQVAFSPDGQSISVGYCDTIRVDVLAADSLAMRFSADTRGLGSINLANTAWSKDGRFLYAGGKSKAIRRWSGAGQGGFTDFTIVQNTLIGIIPLTDGSLVLGSAEPLVAILSPDGRSVWQQRGEIADFRMQNGEAGIRLSQNGDTILFGYEPCWLRSASFSLKTWRLEIDPPADNHLSAPLVQAQGLEVSNWKDQYDPILNGTPLSLKPHEISRSLAIVADGKGFLLGTEFALRFYDRIGKLCWAVDGPGNAPSVNISGDGRLAVAGFADGTLRWYRLSDGKELLALFPHKDGQRWVAWTPQGYYHASAGAEDLIGWHINRGGHGTPEFYGAARFRRQFYRPDVLARVIDTLDVQKALALADQARGQKSVATDIQAILPPTIKILSPASGEKTRSTRLTIIYKAESATGPITALEARVDGRPARVLKDEIETAQDDVRIGQLTIEIPSKNATVSLLAKNQHGTSEPADFYSNWEGVEDWYKPNLYVLAVGVSRYAQPHLNLKYAHKDAQDFVQAVKAQEGGLYRKVTARLLVSADQEQAATKDKILDGLEWLMRDTTSRDVAMVFLSGHGTNDAKGNYHFLPCDADTARLPRTCIDKNDFLKYLSDIPGKTVFFFDSCRSGSVQVGAKADGQAPDVDKFANELADADAGVIVFASSTGKQFSLEKEELQHGVFTSALLEGIAGAADYQKDRLISIAELEVFLPERVKELTLGAQKPVSTKPKAVEDYKIIRVK